MHKNYTAIDHMLYQSSLVVVLSMNNFPQVSNFMSVYINMGFLVPQLLAQILVDCCFLLIIIFDYYLLEY